MSPENVIYAILIGVSTGFINTLAGSGSLITLPFLLFLGLPGDVANGTNRVSILFASAVGAFTLKKQTGMSLKGTGIFIWPTLIAAIMGAWLASELGPRNMETVIAVVLGIMLIPLLLNSKRWLREAKAERNPKLHWLLVVIFLAIGFYGGFIQAGTGVLFLSGMVLVAGYPLAEANVVKNLTVFAYTVPVLVVFIIQDQVDWGIGLIMAAGQTTGAWVAGRFAGKSKKAAVYIHILLVIMVVASMLKLFGAVDWFLELIQA